MAMDFATLVYAPAYSVFARPIEITPTKSQPGQPTYSARGIYGTQPIDVLTENGAIFSDQQTIVDILEREFAVLPMQGDTINIPGSGSLTDLGQFEIIERKTNGGGETTLSIRKIMTARP